MIRLLYTQLQYDINQQTFRIAHPRTEGNPELRNMAQLDELQSDSDYIRRFIETGVARLHVKFKNKLINPDTEMGWWTGWGQYNSNEDSSDDDSSDTETIYDDALNRDIENFDFSLGCDADEKALAMLFHRFVVRYVLWQWAQTFGYGDLAKSFKAESEEALSEISSALFDITMPKKYHESYYECDCYTSTTDDDTDTDAEIVVESDD